METATERPLIGAMFRGPGPAKYWLPGTTGHTTHDPRKHRKPAYSFGTKSSKLGQNTSPGPAYYINSRITRNGMDGTPAYTLHYRTPLQNSFKTPGPGSYAPEKHQTPKHPHPPSYSFGSRTPYSKRDATPAPNAYGLPTVLGPNAVGKRSYPSYSMTSRSKVGSFHEDLKKTPGPGTYRVTLPDNYKCKRPAYSMGGRNFVPGDSTRKPGPGAHYPENVYVTKKIAPKFSFGIRHSEYMAPLIVDPVD